METFSDRLFNLKNKISHFSFNKKNDEKELEHHRVKMAKGQKLLFLKEHKCWPSIEEIFTDIHDEALRAVSKRVLTVEQKQPYIHTLETIALIREKIESRIKDAEISREHYNRLKEKMQDVRRTG